MNLDESMLKTTKGRTVPGEAIETGQANVRERTIDKEAEEEPNEQELM